MDLKDSCVHSDDYMDIFMYALHTHPGAWNMNPVMA